LRWGKNRRRRQRAAGSGNALFYFLSGWGAAGVAGRGVSSLSSRLRIIPFPFPQTGHRGGVVVIGVTLLQLLHSNQAATYALPL
jgi:hypothetical protein